MTASTFQNHGGLAAAQALRLAERPAGSPEGLRYGSLNVL